MPILIPRTAGGQEVQIEVTGGDAARPPLPRPQSLSDLLGNLGRTFPATSIVVTLTRPSRAVSTARPVAEDLPPSALDALRPVALDAQEQDLRTVLQVETPAGRVVSGRAQILGAHRRARPLRRGPWTDPLCPFWRVTRRRRHLAGRAAARGASTRPAGRQARPSRGRRGGRAPGSPRSSSPRCCSARARSRALSPRRSGASTRRSSSSRASSSR